MVLFIFPFTTWMFLQKGENYLIEVIEDIRIPKDSLDNYPFLYAHDNKVDTIYRVSLEDLVSVMFHEDDFDSFKENFLKLDLQMKKANNLQFVVLYDGHEPKLSIPTDISNPVFYYKDINNIHQIFNESKLAVIDAQGLVRSFYSEERDDFILLVKHLGMILPAIDRGR